MLHFKSAQLLNSQKTSLKGLFPGLLTFALLLLMLMYPQKTITGASNGLLMWFNSLLPALLPFMIVSGLLIRLNIVPLLSKMIYPLLRPFFPISQNGSYPVFIGFLSGLPMGAKISAEMAEYDKISRKEAILIASMCNNASPSFILNFAAIKCLNEPSKGLMMLIITYLSSIAASLITYKTSAHGYIISLNHKIKACECTSAENKIKTPGTNEILTKVDSSIMSAFESVVKIGGYIIIFSIIAEFTELLNLPDIHTAIINGLLEITTGMKGISSLSLNQNTKFILLSALLSFGGLSAAAQTKSVIAPAGLSIRFYIKSKITQGIIAVLLSLFVLCF